MLAALSPPASSMDEFLGQVIPPDILTNPDLSSLDAPAASAPGGLSESKLTREGVALAEKNIQWTHVAGGGYYGTHTPGVIKRNVLESPAWYTSYTPYQPEISQGRLEALLNFQTMVADLTGLPIANASLLDEGTAAAEAMAIALNALPAARARRPDKTFVVDTHVFPNTMSVLRSRAEGLGIRLVTADIVEDVKSADGVINGLGQDLVGVLVQYPDRLGGIGDYAAVADKVHAHGALVAAATDLLALTVLTPPGDFGADIAVGSAQRFGVPLGNGGPHAAFMAVRAEHKRRLPGRLVGVSRDRRGNKALRLALQTREQHIRRERATSNICTAQALLANMASLYAVYHGPEGLRAIADKVVRTAAAVEVALRAWGYDVVGGAQFGGVRVRFAEREGYMAVKGALAEHRIAPRIEREGDGSTSLHVFFDETTDDVFVEKLAKIFQRFAPQNRETG
jgi:glycine dehydrogenase